MIKDDGYFEEHHAPLFKTMCDAHIDTTINHSTPYYGPLLYSLARCCGATRALEIGVCKAWTSFFLAMGVKENADRHGVSSHYFGVDISTEIKDFEKMLREKGLEATMLVMDSWDLTKKSFDPEGDFGIIFIDGWHSEQHLLKEVEITYDMLVDSGRGYMVIHDTHAWVMKPLQKILADKRYNFEYIRFMDNYGLTILRKMDNYVEDPDKAWPQGAQEDIVPVDVAEEKNEESK